MVTITRTTIFAVVVAQLFSRADPSRGLLLAAASDLDVSQRGASTPIGVIRH